MSTGVRCAGWWLSCGIAVRMGQGTFTDGPVGLGHARLSVIDAAGGAQPMCNEDASVWITCNGEIFNFVEIRRELLRRGHRMATRSDTEAISVSGPGGGTPVPPSLERTVGASTLDKTAQRLLLGSRPPRRAPARFYTMAEGGFCSTSEAKALLCMYSFLDELI